MTRDELDTLAGSCWEEHNGLNTFNHVKFAASVAAHEREACADLCYKDKEHNIVMSHGTGKRLDMLCAAAIRARTK